jgi:hypothetical protein
MKISNRAVTIIMVCIFSAQGFVPGVVLCRGESGDVTFESAFTPCCSTVLCVSGENAAYFFSMSVDEDTHCECGPCSDTLITVVPFPIPAKKHHSNACLAAVANISADEDQIDMEASSKRRPTSNDRTLIPIKTTVLII